MATVIWDCQGIIYNDHLANGKTLRGAPFKSLLDRLEIEMHEKRLTQQDFVFHQIMQHLIPL